MGFSTSAYHRIPFMTCSTTVPFINQFSPFRQKWSIRLNSMCATRIFSGTIKTKSRKKISIDGLSEFQWNEIEAGQKLTFEAGFRVAYKANFNKNTVVAKRLRSLCLPKKVGC